MGTRMTERAYGGGSGMKDESQKRSQVRGKGEGEIMGGSPSQEDAANKSLKGERDQHNKVEGGKGSTLVWETVATGANCAQLEGKG